PSALRDPGVPPTFPSIRVFLSTLAQSHPGLSPSFLYFRVLDFNRILFLASPPPCNLITSPPPPVSRTVLSASHVIPLSPSQSPIYFLFSCDLSLTPPFPQLLILPALPLRNPV